MEQLFNVPVELFQLEKLVLNKGKNCKVWYQIIDTRGDKNETFNGFLEPDYQCVYAMQKKLDELKPYLLKLRHKSEIEASKVSVTGVIWKGTGDKEAFKIIGSEVSDSEKNMPFDSAVEHVNAGNYDFEMDVRDIILDLEAFAHGYLFEGEKAEPTFGLRNANSDESEENEESEKITDVDFEEITKTETETDNE